MKQPTRPSMAGIETLSAPKLNDIRFSARHTVLTPQLLEKISKSAPSERKH